MKLSIYPGQTRLNSVRFISLEGDLCRALVNVDVLFISRGYRDKLMSRKDRFYDIDRVEITLLSSERQYIMDAIERRLKGESWPDLLYFGDDKDYAWTKKAIQKWRPLVPVSLSKYIERNSSQAGESSQSLT